MREPCTYESLFLLDIEESFIDGMRLASISANSLKSFASFFHRHELLPSASRIFLPRWKRWGAYADFSAGLLNVRGECRDRKEW